MARGWEPSLALVALSGASFLCFSGPYVINAACLAHLYQSCSSAGVCAYRVIRDCALVSITHAGAYALVFVSDLVCVYIYMRVCVWREREKRERQRRRQRNIHR